jgi:putative hemolysin
VIGGYWIWIVLGGIVLGGFFAALQLSLRESARVVLEQLCAARRDPAATARIHKILDDIDGHAASVALPRIFFNLVVAIGAVIWIAHLRGHAPGDPFPDWFELVAGLAAAAGAVWLFGLAVPLSIADHAGERMVYAWSGLIRATHILLRPLGAVVSFLDEVVRRLTGATAHDQEEALQAELLSVVEEGEREGQFDESERDMIEAVVEFRNRTVEQVMTPRIDIEALELTNDLGAVISLIKESNHSRIPVYEGSLDHIVGVFYVKDLMRWLAGDGSKGSGKPFSLREILRPAIFVPETKTVRELLAELLKSRVHIAVVADEYGGTAGIVTMEDIIEEVFGDIQDEYELPEDEPPGVQIHADGHSAHVDARMNISDANAELRPLGIELPESEEYDTVGGFVVTTLGRIPGAGETLSAGRAKVTVLEAEPTRVSKVRVEVAEPQAPLVPEEPPRVEVRSADQPAAADRA